MKRCPKCGQVYTEDNSFCLDDGTTLVGNTADSGAYSMPTQVFQAPMTSPTVPAKGASPMLYLALGVLLAAVAGMGTYMFVLRDAGNSNADPKQGTANISAANSGPVTTAPTSAPIADTPANGAPATRPGPVYDPAISPAGRWSGDWVHNKRTSSFTAVMELQQNGGTVDGRIVWTLVSSSNPEKMYKSGLTAVEYVRGTFDPETRLVKIRGYRKDDPNKLVIYDNYNLSLSNDSKAMSGTSKNGQFSLRR